MVGSERRKIRAADVGELRRRLVGDLRHGVPGAEPGRAWHGLPASVRSLVGDLGPARVRTGLAWVAVGTLSARDVWLWIDSAGLRGVRTAVRTLAAQHGLSARQAHRRILEGDEVVARALEALPEGGLDDLVRRGNPGDRSSREVAETVRAECHRLPEPERALDAVRMYHRNRRAPAATMGPGAYLGGNKDTRYRDAGRVGPWLGTMALDPPVPSVAAADAKVLLAATGTELADDPHEALGQVNQAIRDRRRDLLPVLLAHAGRLIPGVRAAGAEAWLGYLQARFHAAMEAESIVALRFARALQVETARYSPLGVADARVRRGMTGRGQILQMFGHYDAAHECYAQAVRHAAHFRPDRDRPHEQAAFPENVHDAAAQLVYTEALRRGDPARAFGLMRRVHTLADREDRVEVQFTRERRALELLLGYSARRDDLTLAPSSRSRAHGIDEQFRRFAAVTDAHSSPNRLLSGQDITLLYAVLTRDAGLAGQARDRFQEINDEVGGYANLADRFNARLRAAKGLSEKFRGIEEVRGPSDPLRDPRAVPGRATGLLVRPDAGHG